jgi:hypothetical protein
VFITITIIILFSSSLMMMMSVRAFISSSFLPDLKPSRNQQQKIWNFLLESVCSPKIIYLML